MLTNFFIVFCALALRTVEPKLLLKQVVILSRHNVRTPLSKNLNQLSPKPWPHWKEKSGYLTAKGAYLEGIMGSYFSAWLRNEGLLQGNCPTEDIFYAYANAKQRAKASAIAFVNEAFPNCNVAVHCKEDSDAVFNPIIHNTTKYFRTTALKEMNNRLKSLSLNNSLLFVENILDYKHSELCKRKNECDLCLNNNVVNFAVGYKPNVSGPLKVAKSAIDAFVMAYYEGFPLKEVAWGLISDEQKWQSIMDISKGYHDVIFNTTLVAKDIAEPLIKYMSRIFLNDKETPKIALIMGHDANILTVLNSLNFKAYNLKGQYEKSPVGGKIIFQKWYDTENNKDLLRINFVYQSMEQLRNAVNLTLVNPPQFTLLELKSCKVNRHGFCLWNDFITFLKSFL